MPQLHPAGPVLFQEGYVAGRVCRLQPSRLLGITGDMVATDQIEDQVSPATDHAAETVAAVGAEELAGLRRSDPRGEAGDDAAGAAPGGADTRLPCLEQTDLDVFLGQVQCQ